MIVVSCAYPYFALADKLGLELVAALAAESPDDRTSEELSKWRLRSKRRIEAGALFCLAGAADN